jgi:hypothetical protein
MNSRDRELCIFLFLFCMMMKHVNLNQLYQMLTMDHVHAPAQISIPCVPDFSDGEKIVSR